MEDRPIGSMIYRGAYCGIRADWKAQKQAHNFSRSWQSTYCCSRCLATSPFKHAPPDLVYLNFSERAPYSNTILTTQEYLTHDKQPSPWRVVRGFSLETCHADILHVIFLGIARGLCASFLIEVIGAMAGTEECRLGELNRDLGRWCRARQLRAQRSPFCRVVSELTPEADSAVLQLLDSCTSWQDSPRHGTVRPCATISQAFSLV